MLGVCLKLNLFCSFVFAFLLKWHGYFCEQGEEKCVVSLMVKHSYWFVTPISWSGHPSRGCPWCQGCALGNLIKIFPFEHLISLRKANICILSEEETGQAPVFSEGFSDISYGFVLHLFWLLCRCSWCRSLYGDKTIKQGCLCHHCC